MMNITNIKTFPLAAITHPEQDTHVNDAEILTFCHCHCHRHSERVIIVGLLSSPAYALKEKGFILILVLYVLAGVAWALFWYLYKIEPSMTKREVDAYYLVHLLFFIFVNLFAHQGSKVIIIASSYWWPSTVVTAPIFSKHIDKKNGFRGSPDYLIHYIVVSVPGETSMPLQVTPSFYARVKKGQHLNISSRETPLAYVYSGFYQLESTILYE
ncbi:hypothetical protein [Vitreoscilla stercoraria]|uniref:Uncharacterized protein n=1 Tax=Vitreoscilla stercoraria TaxID=61 RepID=A0ABY4EAU7_VITST|nr:hypothetical protein [Vitreoscilla stercoraria]UOO92525.1 hypothetical protein LVJ81_00255 [Vitreoscilla stercoraria]